MTNLYEAHDQWRNRPDDERFSNIAELKTAVATRKNTSVEGMSIIKDLKVVEDNDVIAIDFLQGKFMPTNWAFDQLCEQTKCPPAFLRTLSPKIIADTLNFKLNYRQNLTKMLLNIDVAGNKFVRAFTSPEYGRVWDLDLVQAVENLQQDNASWKNPPAYKVSRIGNSSTLENSGLYASDRDIFMFLVDEEHKIELDAKDGNKRLLSRGFFVWNSEVRAKSFGMMTFLYDYVCGNHIVWNAEKISVYRKIHTRNAPEVAVKEMIPMLSSYTKSNCITDLTVLKKAVDFKMAENKEKTIEFLENKGILKSDAVNSFEYAEKENNDGTYLWNCIQNLTSSAREKRHMDERVNLEVRAGKLLELVS